MKHVYRFYENLNITVCQNCAKFKKEIEKHEHSGHCDPTCPRCQAEVCDPKPLTLIKPV